jgi:hypothetical protein
MSNLVHHDNLVKPRDRRQSEMPGHVDRAPEVVLGSSPHDRPLLLRGGSLDGRHRFRDVGGRVSSTRRSCGALPCL